MESGTFITVLWLLAGAVLVLLETFTVPGIGFLYAGLASITVGGLLAAGYFDQADLTLQFSWFFGFTALWAVVLWKPMKRLRYRTTDKEYKNMVGSTAVVKDIPLTKNKLGNVQWSGTIMQAKLADDSPVESVPAGEEVIVTAAEGNRFIVKPVKGKENN